MGSSPSNCKTIHNKDLPECPGPVMNSIPGLGIRASSLPVSAQIRTGDTGFKVLGANHYTTETQMSEVGFEPTRVTTVDLKSTPLDQLGHPDFIIAPNRA